MKYYLIGRNIQSSLSPRIHNYLFKLKDRPQTYQPPVEGKTFSLRQMEDRSFGGISITIPYKTHYSGEIGVQKDGVLSSKHGISNTIYKNNFNKLIATNTDIFGIQQCFSGKIQQIEHRNALIIGAGATAQTYCSFFQTQKIKTSFINRSIMKQHLKSRFNNILDFLPLKPSHADLKNCPIYSIVVNTLPSQVVRQHWQHLQLNLLNLLRNYPRASAIKIIYMNVNYRQKLDPIQQLLKNRLNLRVQTLKGIDMLLWQALEQNRFFCNQSNMHIEEYQWQLKKLRQQLGLH